LRTPEGTNETYAVWMFALFISFFYLFILQAGAQVERIVIAAGTPEDHDLQTITSEQDPQKKLGMYEDFVKKYVANPAAVAMEIGSSLRRIRRQVICKRRSTTATRLGRLSAQSRHPGVAGKHCATSEKQRKARGLRFDRRRGVRVDKQTGKPEDVSAEDFTRQVAEEKSSVQNSCDFLESAGFNAIVSETDPKGRMGISRSSLPGFRSRSFRTRFPATPCLRWARDS